MHRFVLLFLVSLATAGFASAAAPPVENVQGLYEGTAKVAGAEQKIEARIVAWGKGTYKVFVRQSPDKGKAANVSNAGKVELDGKLAGDTIRFSGNAESAEWAATYAAGAIRGTIGTEGKLELKRVVRLSPTLGAKPPAGAIVLLDGKKFDEVTKKPRKDGSEQKWKLAGDGAIEVPKGGMRSKRQVTGSFKLHVEFKINLRPEARGQQRGNSGVFLPNGTEIQVLDSFGMTTYKGGGCGGLGKLTSTDCFDEFSLASAPPLQWQTYDVEYRVQKKEGKLTGRPRVTVLHNGILIHDKAELGKEARVGEFNFQDHGNPVQFRNLWYLPLTDE